MKIVCSTDMPYAREAFSTLGDVVMMDGRVMKAADVRDATILATRSTTRVNRALLEGSGVRFVGTATIGFDHIDTAYLEQAGIRWCYSPGCNANSVSEYITSALLCLAHRHQGTLAGQVLGVIGVGNVGTRVVQKAEALGLRVLRNDPPRARGEGRGRTENGMPVEFVTLQDVLRKADIVTLHTPLTKTGPDATHHLANAGFFAQMKRGSVFINSARGPIVVTDALLAALAEGRVAHAVLDTWEGEPACRADMLRRADLGTPHIAGYSFEGKVMGTYMVYQEACRFLGLQPTWTPDALMPAPEVPEISVTVQGRRDDEVLWDIVRRVYDVELDDRALRAGCLDDDVARGRHFDQLRIHYRVRREFRFTRVRIPDAGSGLRRKIADIGFQVM